MTDATDGRIDVPKFRYQDRRVGGQDQIPRRRAWKKQRWRCGRQRPSRLSDSNRTILAAKELRLITQTLVRRLINLIFDATLRKVRRGRLDNGSHTS